MNRSSILSFYLSLLLSISFSCQVANTTDQSYTDAAQINDTIQAEDTVALSLATEISPYRAEKTKFFDLIHTKLAVSFDWEKQYLNGTATLELRPYFYPQSSLTLDAKGFDIHKVALLDSEGAHTLQYQYDGKLLTIALDKNYTREEKLFVEIVYTAKPYEMEAGGSQAITSSRGLYFINADGSDPELPRQIWTQGEPESNSCWFPTLDTPNQRTTQEMYITIDEDFTTLSNGTLIYSQLNEDGTKTDYWKMDKPHAPYLFMMAIGNYAVVKDKWEDMEVSYYVEPEYEQYARNIFGNTPEMLSFFSKKLDYKYPWDKYAQVVVRDFVSGAMENTTASTFMEAVQVTDRELLDKHWDGIIAHELFHHWFGNLVTCESWSNIPLNEAFANYSEYLWTEHKYGIDEADYEGLNEMEDYLAEAESKQVDLIRFYYEDKEDMFDNHSYAKGGRILHMLRKYVGDDAFFASLSYYLKKNAFSDVEIHNLRLAFEAVTGEDLNWFFNQWFLASGHPKLAVTNKYENGTLILQVDQLQDFVTTPLYRLPLYVDVYYGGKKERFAVVIDDEREVFEFDVSEQPSLVVFDAEQQLLGEVSYEQDIDELAFQYSNTEKFLSRYRAITGLSEHLQNVTAKQVLQEALNDSFWGVRQEAIAAFDGYSDEGKEEIVAKIVAMAKGDEKSIVRADALATLVSFGPDQFRDIFKKALEDPSFAVIGAALYGYGQTEAVDKATIFASYEKVDNVNVIISLADFYALQGVEDKFDWFVQKTKVVTRGDLYYFLQYFGQYLMKMPAPIQYKGAKILEEFASNHETFYIKLAAFQGLLLLEETEEVNEIINRIKREETDERLKGIYANF